MKNNYVLITGGNGFIGSHISTKFVDEGYNVIVICRRNKSENPLFNKYLEENKIKIIQGDITNFDYSQIKENITHIIHTAGKVSAYGKMKDFLNINLNSTKKLLEYASSLKELKCFTYLSSTAVYGYYGYTNLKEEDEKKPFKNPYSLTKLETENFVKEYATSHKLNFVIARPGNVYGEYDRTSSYEIYSRVKKQKMSICANGKYKSCFVYSGNLANAVFHITTTEKCYNTDYNITDGNNETLREYLTLVAKEFGVKAKFLNFPAFLAKTVACIVEGTYKLFCIKKAPLITKFSIWQNCVDYSFSIDKLLKTGYTKEFSMEDGVKNTVKWFNSLSDTK